MVAPKISRRRKTLIRKYDMPLMLPTRKDTMAQGILLGRIDLSYDPMRIYDDIDLDSDQLDLEMELRQLAKGDKRFIVSMNVLEDWRVIDECVKESDCYEANEVISRISKRSRR